MIHGDGFDRKNVKARTGVYKFACRNEKKDCLLGGVRWGRGALYVRGCYKTEGNSWKGGENSTNAEERSGETNNDLERQGEV